jgi:hypothetical protein
MVLLNCPFLRLYQGPLLIKVIIKGKNIGENAAHKMAYLERDNISD